MKKELKEIKRELRERGHLIKACCLAARNTQKFYNSCRKKQDTNGKTRYAVVICDLRNGTVATYHSAGMNEADCRVNYHRMLRTKKKHDVNWVRSLHNDGLSNATISKITGFPESTVMHYLNPAYECGHFYTRLYEQADWSGSLLEVK